MRERAKRLVQSKRWEAAIIGLIVIMCLLVALFPSLVIWLPDVLYTK